MRLGGLVLKRQAEACARGAEFSAPSLCSALPVCRQNFTRIAKSINDSFFRRSGNHTLLKPPPQAVSAAPSEVCPDELPLLHAKNCGAPLFPPGGVIPPCPSSTAHSRGGSHTPPGT